MVNEFPDLVLDSRFSLTAGRNSKPDPSLPTIAKLADFETQEVSCFLTKINNPGFLPV